MDNKKILNITRDAPGYLYQGPRFKRLGPNSGEQFRDEILLPWFDLSDSSDSLTIDFKGTRMFSPSFLEEAFGGAIRKGYEAKIDLLDFLNIPTSWRKDVEKYISDAKKVIKKNG